MMPQKKGSPLSGAPNGANDNPNKCPYCGAPNGSGCGHGIGGNQGSLLIEIRYQPGPS